MTSNCLLAIRKAGRSVCCALLLFGGCATGGGLSTREGGGLITREDWVLVPSRTGPSEVLSREQYADDVAHHRRRRVPNKEAIPPRLLDLTTPVELQPRQVKAFLLVDEPVRTMSVEGRSIEVFWTKPYFIDRMEQGHLVEHRGADVYVRGVTPGESLLQLQLTDGSSRVVRIAVSGRPAS
jgi:hypothetical protein